MFTIAIPPLLSAKTTVCAVISWMSSTAIPFLHITQIWLMAGLGVISFTNANSIRDVPKLMNPFGESAAIRSAVPIKPSMVLILATKTALIPNSTVSI
ncbi:MAG: hypothetical protein KA293_02665 [Bacteroidia bacterium]|nr:hypothetical protein [Bacteroidota bacterium]MBP6639168.1 hypothetical protein [Bacteroidia bacterium]